MNGCVAVIILQYGQAETTIECIKSVQRYNTYPIKYIVVDNCSPLERDRQLTEQALRELFGEDVLVVNDGYTPSAPLPRATFLRSSENDGYARGNNKGLRLAYADIEIDKVLILNNDILFCENIIPRMVTDIDTHLDCAIVSPLLYTNKELKETDPNCARTECRFRDILLWNLFLLRNPGNIVHNSYILVLPNTGLHPVQLISGSCMMSKKCFFENIRSFDPETFLYYEENILWEKIKRVGKHNYIDTDIKCIHLGAATTIHYFSPFFLWQSLKSQRHFVRNYLPHGRLKVALLSIANFWCISAISAGRWLKKFLHSVK